MKPAWLNGTSGELLFNKSVGLLMQYRQRPSALGGALKCRIQLIALFAPLYAVGAESPARTKLNIC